MMKMIRLFYAMFMIVGIVRNDMSAINIQRTNMQRIDKTEQPDVQDDPQAKQAEPQITEELAPQDKQDDGQVIQKDGQVQQEDGQVQQEDGEGQQPEWNGCPNPFKLDQMAAKLTDKVEVEGEGADAIDYHYVRLTTKTSSDPEKVACRYQMYCTAVQAQAYEGLLGSKEKFDDLEKKLAKEESEYYQAVQKQQQAQQQLINARNIRISRRLAKKKKFFGLLIAAAAIAIALALKRRREAERRRRAEEARRRREEARRRAIAAKQKAISDAENNLKQSEKNTAKEKQEMEDARETLRVKQGTCGKCPGDFELNWRVKPMVQILKQKEDNKFYLVNEAQLEKELYDGKFDQDVNRESPIIKRIDCYVSFEKAGMVLVGDQYGEEVFEAPIDMFRDAYMITLGSDFTVSFDLNTENGAQFIPELTKLKYDLQDEGCLSQCTLTSEADLAFNEQEIKSTDAGREQMKQLREFEDNFNNKYLANIKNFIQSIQTVYHINKMCAKVIKLLKFGEFRNNEYTDFATAGGLSDYYIGNDLNVNELGIHGGGFKSEFLIGFITMDRQCMINKMFGRSMYQ